MEKLNIAELLKDCPKGMELDCTIWDNVVLAHVDMKSYYPIWIKKMDGKIEFLTENGCFDFGCSAKCVIFPKGKTTWEGFVPPYKFKDGDIYYIKDVFGQEWVSIIKKCENDKLYTYVDIGISNNTFYCEASEGTCYCKDIIEHRLATEEEKKKLFDAIKANGYYWNAEIKTLEKLPKFKDGDIVYVKTINHHEYILIFKEIKNDQIHKYVCFTYQRLSIDKCPVCQLVDAEIMRLATEEEKVKLLNAIKENGYHWNADTKTLEKLVIKPKFQVGDCVWHHKYGIGDITQMIWIDNEIVYETHFCDTHFVDFTTYCKSNELRKYELSPNKFDVTTLQPFDKVLVRGFGGVWGINIFGFYDGNNKECPFYCIGQTATGWNQCVPYWKNEHLLGTTDDCDDFYKTWE